MGLPVIEAEEGLLVALVGDELIGLAETGGAGITGEPVDAAVGAFVSKTIFGLFVNETGGILGLGETGAAVLGGPCLAGIAVAGDAVDGFAVVFGARVPLFMLGEAVIFVTGDTVGSYEEQATRSG